MVLRDILSGCSVGIVLYLLEGVDSRTVLHMELLKICKNTKKLTIL